MSDAWISRESANGLPCVGSIFITELFLPANFACRILGIQIDKSRRIVLRVIVFGEPSLKSLSDVMGKSHFGEIPTTWSSPANVDS